MKQVLRKGLKDIVVDEVPDPVPAAHHVLVRPVCSLISAGTETASIHNESLLSGVAENPSHLRKIYDAMKVAGPMRTVAEVSAKFYRSTPRSGTRAPDTSWTDTRRFRTSTSARASRTAAKVRGTPRRCSPGGCSWRAFPTRSRSRKRALRR